MKTKTFFLLAIGAGILAYANQAQLFKKKVSVKIRSIKFLNKESLSTGYRELRMIVSTTLKNPTDFSIKVNAFNANLIFLGKNIGISRSAGEVSIPARSEIEIKIPLAIITKEIFPSLKSAVELITSQNPVNVQVVGNVETSLAKVNFNTTLKLLS